jgi:putative endonuclease
MPPVNSSVALGKLGEDLARRELERRGYAVLATRYRSRYGEIDIVCDLHGVVVFVEVKARRTRRYGGPEESIPARKRRRIGAMALDYLAWTHRMGRACRFDVVTVEGLGTDQVTVEVLPDAFQIDGAAAG